jgi:hypothetical protein
MSALQALSTESTEVAGDSDHSSRAQSTRQQGGKQSKLFRVWGHFSFLILFSALQ